MFMRLATKCSICHIYEAMTCIHALELRIRNRSDVHHAAPSLKFISQRVPLSWTMPSSGIMGQLVAPPVSNLHLEILCTVFRTHPRTRTPMFYEPKASSDSLLYKFDRMKLVQDIIRYSSQVCRRWCLGGAFYHCTYVGYSGERVRTRFEEIDFKL